MSAQALNSPARRVAEGLGWLSIGIGLAEILMPSTVARVIGLAPTPAVRHTMRRFGFREIGSGAAILAAPGDPRRVWARVAGDALDLMALNAAMRPNGSDATRLRLAAAGVVGVTIADVLCAMQLSRQARGQPDLAGAVQVQCGITIRRPIAAVYRFWQNFENFPQFMRHLESVTETGDRQSRWCLIGPAGVRLEWEAEIVSDQEDHMISWRSLPGSAVDHRGAVWFEDAPAGRGTEVHVEMAYRAPAGRLGRAIAWIAGKDPRQQVREDLRRVKQILEVGEVVLSDGPGLLQPAQAPASAAAAKIAVGVEP
jgi:uncharacterized membrane protein